MSLKTWIKYNEFFPSYSSLFDDFMGPDLFEENKKEESVIPPKKCPSIKRNKPLTKARRKEIVRLLAREIVFD